MAQPGSQQKLGAPANPRLHCCIGPNAEGADDGRANATKTTASMVHKERTHGWGDGSVSDVHATKE